MSTVVRARIDEKTRDEAAAVLGARGLTVSDAFRLALIVMVITALFSTMFAMAFRKRFFGSGVLFYTIMTDIMVPGILLSLGLATLLKQLGIPPAWWSTGLGVHMVWTLPFGFLVMMAVFNRFDSGPEEAARDIGASEWTVFKEVTLPLITPGSSRPACSGSPCPTTSSRAPPRSRASTTPCRSTSTPR